MSSAFNIPAGFALVPREPTQAIVEAFAATGGHHPNQRWPALLAVAAVDAVPGEPAEFERVARLLDTRGSDEDRYAAKIIRAQAAWADRLSGERNAAHAALQELIPMFAAWHEEFPDDVGDKEGPALSRAREALAAPVASRAGMEPVTAMELPSDEEIWSNDLVMAANASAGLPMLVLGLLVRNSLRAFAIAPSAPAEAKDAAPLHAYLSKLPSLDPTWPKQVQDGWMKCFDALQSMGAMEAKDAVRAEPAKRIVSALVNAACLQEREPSEANQNAYRAARDKVEAALAAPTTLRQPEAAGEAPADSSGAGRLAVPDGMVMVPRSVLGWHIKPVGEEPECCDRGRRPDGSISDECCGNGACCQTREEAEARRSWEGILATDAAAEGGQA